MLILTGCTCSHDLSNYRCANAIDGNPATLWNSGGYAPQFIELTLNQPVSALTLSWTPAMTPATGDVEVEFLLISNTTPVAKFRELFYAYHTGFTERVLLYSKQTNPQAARILFDKVRMTFVQSPSWIAVSEISVQ